MARKEICFVILPFNKEFDVVWECIRRAVKTFRYLKVLRNNAQITGFSTFPEIKEKITKSALIIADVSFVPGSAWPYPNVMTEAGIALGYGKEPYLISNSNVQNLPSGWNQYRVDTYVEKSKNLEDLELWFVEYLENLMEQSNISTEPAIQKRTTQSQKLNWLVQVVHSLRDKARETYQDESRTWTVSRILFTPYGCLFTLTHQYPTSNEEARGSFVEIQCGVHFYSWNRRKTPFTICTRWLDTNKQELGRTEEPILLKESLEQISAETLWYDFEEKLDQILETETSGFSKLTPLAKSLRDMEKIVEKLQKLEIAGLVRKQESRTFWGINGFCFPYYLEDDSEINLLIDFRFWEEKGNPFWICFKPEGRIIDIASWFRETPFGDGLNWFIRVPGQQTDEIIRGYQNVISELIKNYKPQKTSPNTTRLRAENWNVQSWAKEALSKIGPDSEINLSPNKSAPAPTPTRRLVRTETNNAVSTLLEALQDEEWIVRREAAESLGGMGNTSPEVVTGLVGALHDENKDVRKKVAWALGKIGTDSTEAALALVEILKDSNPDVRYWGAWSLGELGAKAKGAIPELVETLKDPSPDIREKAGLVLGKMGSEAKGAVPALLELMKDDYEEVLKKAAWALGQIRPDSKETVPAFIGLMKNTNWKTRYEAAGALARIGSEAKEAVPVLVEALKDENEDVRKKAALALGEIGSEAKEAITALVEVLKAEDYSIRYISAEALKKIKGKEYLKL
ncbi:MAG: HEAT repeat domain-containing protein [Planctomycetota bacterium]